MEEFARTLGVLKVMVANSPADCLSVVMSFFYERLGKDQAFLALHRPAANSPEMSRALAKALAESDAQVTTAVVSVPECDFMYGIAGCGGVSGAFIYFTDIKQGLLDFPGTTADGGENVNRFTGRGKKNCKSS